MMKLIQQCNTATMQCCNSATQNNKQRKHNEVNTTMQYCNNTTLLQCYGGYLEQQKIQNEGNECSNAILQQCNNATDITKHEGNKMKPT